jgi:predicted methyltransferase
LNQFPCDENSRNKRALFLKSRYPFVEYLKFAIIGEDDFLSTEFVNDYWAWPVIIEKDKRILNIIKKISPRFKIIEDDVCNFPHLKKLPEVQTFITDPPYTLDGSLAFVYAGLKMLKKGLDVKEFYVILNPTIMSKHFFTVQKVLSESDVYLTETISNFSQYKLPNNFQEKKRAIKFLKKIGLNNNSLMYSSSSNMYIFRTISPNLIKLRKQINFKKIYQHYL